MKNRYTVPLARNRIGKTFGFAGIDRLSSLSLRAAQPIDWHEHGETELLCCLKGSFGYEFGQRPPVTLPAGCFVVIPPGTRHRLRDGIDGPGRRFSIFLSGPGTPDPGPLSRAEFRRLLSVFQAMRLRPRTFPPLLMNDLTYLADAVLSDRKTDEWERLSLRARTLHALVLLAKVPLPHAAMPEVRMMEEAVKWLESHAAEKVSVDQLVAYMGYGRSRFFELFKRHTGLSPTEWLTRFRIDRAQKLLRQPGTSVAAVARACGFADVSFFARIFRRRTGRTPSAFAQRLAAADTGYRERAPARKREGEGED